MTRRNNPYRFLFAGGGTGGHLFPAVAVAEKIKDLKPDSEILFVGTKNKIEARVVPKIGFNFRTIWISGFARKFELKNILFPLKLIVSMIQSLLINIKFKPRVTIGTGAYVAGPVIWGASIIGSKIMLLEQNSYPGVTNRLLEKKADQIHINFEESKKYFRCQSKVKLSGNPIRTKLSLGDKGKALAGFNLNAQKKTFLVLGGSLGALSINEAVKNNLISLKKIEMQIIWQTGELYFDSYKKFESEDVKVFPFIDRMESAYSACDLVLARAGATTIAELSLLGLPAIFAPSSNVAANHQFKNAKSLEEAGAATLIEDKNLSDRLFEKINELIFNEEKLSEFKKKIKKFSKPDAAKIIAENAIMLAEQVS